MKKALIIGISGQDGAYLSKLLLDKGYEVYGASRDAEITSFRALRRLDSLDKVQLSSMSLTDFRSILQVLTRTQPDEVYNLAGQSSVGLSFQQPVETIESIAVGTLNLLEALRFLARPIRFYNAGSVECFGDTHEVIDERSPLRPISPYGVAKAAAFWEVANYRQAYGLFACSGMLSNHESPLRPERFVTRKIVAAACRIARGSKETLSLGNIEILRDWGWAPEYATAMWLMLQRDEPQDYVIGTGMSYTLREFVEHAFKNLGLDWRNHIEIRTELQRPSEIFQSRIDPSKARMELGWQAQSTMPDVVRMMVADELGSPTESEQAV
ncbi:MAG TPA: GDP-mannose 4,6-dehydratase, partial [Terriglobales bacterium]